MTQALIGGVLIGVAVSIMLLFNGRVTGISGIIAGLIKPQKGEVTWRSFFIGGLIVGGVIVTTMMPQQVEQFTSAKWYDFMAAGLLVGFGTLLGNGCTSGHGVCGISRFSIRSIMATVTFIFFGAVSVFIFKTLRGEL
jgi:uncharacterized protein